MHKYATRAPHKHPRGYPPARLGPPMGPGGHLESILGHLGESPGTPLESLGDQLPASTRPVTAKGTKKDTQSIDCAESRVP